MNYNRIVFDFPGTAAVDTGTRGDTGPAIWGELLAFRWNPLSVPGSDTGATIRLDLLPRAGDTGDGWTIYSKAAASYTDFVEAPRQAISIGTAGLDASGDTGWTPHVFAGDRLRVKITNPAANANAINARLYVYFKD